MNKYINTFASSGDYETYKASSAFTTPNVAYIEDTNEVKWLNSKKDLYNIYGTLTGDSATATIQINYNSYTVSPSGSENEFGLNYAQPVTQLMFQNQRNIKTLDKLDIDTSAMTDMQQMFIGCTALTSLDVSNWDTSKVTNMGSMFSSCQALTSLDLSNWNTSGVTNMQQMFNRCSRLTSLDVSNWNTSGVTNMQKMFNSCQALTSLDLSSFNTSKVTDITNMFSGCIKLATLNLSNWDLSKVPESSGSIHLFNWPSNITTIILNNTNQYTFDYIKGQYRPYDTANSTIIRDGVNWKYQNGAWVEA